MDIERENMLAKAWADAADEADRLRQQVAATESLLPDDYSESKDWKSSGAHGRIEWLKIMFESRNSEAELLLQQVATQKAYYESVFEDGAKRIRALTEQRDMAVEALHNCYGIDEDGVEYVNYSTIKQALAAIQSSEVTG